tara:strand:- start:190 stop:399 length:210 start_codon:yes stop_codon:yes gene_type:complete
MKKRKKNLHILIDQAKLRAEEEKYIKKKKMKNWGEKFLLAVGWIAVSPFVIRECVIWGFKWVIKKIKKK